MKIIHLIWLQGEENLPDKYREYLKKYRAMKNYTVMLWDNKSIRKLIVQTFSGCLLKVYDYYPFWVMRVDLAKYVILYNYGGFYVDMDTYPLTSSFDELIEKANNRPIVTYYNIHENKKYRKFSWILSHILNNNFMYSPTPKHSFYRMLSLYAQCTYKRAVYDFKVYYILASIGPFYVYDIMCKYTNKYGSDSIYKLHLQNLKKYIHDDAANSWCNSEAWFIDTDYRDKIVLAVSILVVVYVVYSLIWMWRRPK